MCLVMVNVLLTKFRYASIPAYLTLAYILGEGGADVGVIAAFWHVPWVAGVLVMVSGLSGLAIYLIYSRQLKKANAPPSQ